MRKRVIELCLIARPDLFILNPGLSDGNGLLRQQPDLRSLPLVVYSARGLERRTVEVAAEPNTVLDEGEGRGSRCGGAGAQDCAEATFSGGFATKLNRLAIAPPGDSTSLGEDEKVATCEVF